LQLVDRGVAETGDVVQLNNKRGVRIHGGSIS
jgi:hypothetical protein